MIDIGDFSMVRGWAREDFNDPAEQSFVSGEACFGTATFTATFYRDPATAAHYGIYKKPGSDGMVWVMGLGTEEY